MAEKYTTLGGSTLNGAITSSATSLVVTSAASFPTSGTFRIRIDDEIMAVTAVASATFTVTRGTEGTSAAAHSDLATVTEVLTAAALDAIRTDLINTGTLASLPAASKAGNLYLPSDGFQIYRDSGSANVPWGPIFPFVAPVDGDFSWVNQSTAAVSTTYGGINLKGVADSSNAWRMRQKSVPSTPYTIDVVFSICGGANIGNFTRSAIVWRESSSGKLVSVSAFTEFDKQTRTLVEAWDSNTAYNSAPTQSGFAVYGGLLFYRLIDDGTNREAWVSTDGQYWVRFYQQSRTTHMTADQIGFGICTTSQSITQMTIRSWYQH